MNRVFIFSRPVTPKVEVSGEEIGWKRLNFKWVYVDIESMELALIYDESRLEFKLSDSNQFAIYKGELLSLKTSPHRILLISDLDNTLYNHTDQGKSAYNDFIIFWIKNYEFNGSKLVYNTGRHLSEYNQDKIKFYEPDLLMSALGNYAYKYDENENLVL
jgi:hypothetical protein